MYLEFFGLSEKPFSLEPDPRFVVLSRDHREALATLLYTVEEREGWALLQGEAGLGKTSVLQSLLTELDENVIPAVLTNPRLDIMDFYNRLALELGLPGPFSSKGAFLIALEGLLDQCREHGESLLLVLDDAQLLTPALVEEVRLLGSSDQGGTRVLNIFLSARPLIHYVFDKAGDLGLRQRLHRFHQLTPLTPDEVVSYIKHRLAVAGGPEGIFNPDCFEAIHHFTHGVPRLINSLCDHALLAAFGQQEHEVSLKRVEEEAGRMQVWPTRMGQPPEQEQPAPDQELPRIEIDPAYEGMGSQWHSCGVGHTHPRPELEPEDRKLEARLMNRCHQAYRNMPWWEKTAAFTVEWDRVRRRRLGVLGTSFPSFCPRWVDKRWDEFNLARRQADALGARYTHYINAQYLRLLGDRLGELPPSQLLGQEAAEYYRKLDEHPDGHPEPQVVRAPFSWHEYNHGNEQHNGHAAATVEEIFDMASHVCTKERKGHDDMLTEAVCQAVLPFKALSSMPELQKAVAAKLEQRAQAPPQPEPPRDHPPIII